MKAKKITRAQLLRVIGKLQDLVGRAKGAYWDDRQADRADTVVGPLNEAFDLCVAARSDDPPEDAQMERLLGVEAAARALAAEMKKPVLDSNDEQYRRAALEALDIALGAGGLT